LADDENMFNLAGISNADGQNSIKKTCKLFKIKKHPFFLKYHTGVDYKKNVYPLNPCEADNLYISYKT